MDYAACCGPYHAHTRLPPDAAALMRARYSAYVKNLEAYVRQTWHPQTCPHALGMETLPRPQWLGLELRAHDQIDAQHATVEFVARYKLNGRAYRLHEVSRFEHHAGQWRYVDGEQKA